MKLNSAFLGFFGMLALILIESAEALAAQEAGRWTCKGALIAQPDANGGYSFDGKEGKYTVTISLGQGAQILATLVSDNLDLPVYFNDVGFSSSQSANMQTKFNFSGSSKFSGSFELTLNIIDDYLHVVDTRTNQITEKILYETSPVVGTLSYRGYEEITNLSMSCSRL